MMSWSMVSSIYLDVLAYQLAFILLSPWRGAVELAGILLSSSVRALNSALLCPWMRGLLGWSTVTRSPWSMLSSALLLSFDACQCLSRRMFVSFCNVCCKGMVSPVSSRSLFSPACQCPRSAHTPQERRRHGLNSHFAPEWLVIATRSGGGGTRSGRTGCGLRRAADGERDFERQGAWLRSIG